MTQTNGRNVCLLTLGLALFLVSAPTEVAAGQGPNQGCSLFKPCGDGLSCIPFAQVCHRDSGALSGEKCQAGYPCAAGLTCEAGSHVCRGPGKVGDACHLTRPCGAGLTCEAGSHVCRAAGKVGDPCHATRPCGTGLTCEAGSHVCRAAGKVGDPCHATRPCGDGLSCAPGVHKCYHSPRLAGEPCSLGYPCGSPETLECKAVIQRCFPKEMDLTSARICSAFKSADLADAAKDSGMTMTYGWGESHGGGFFVANEGGMVYGQNGEFGCYFQTCLGGASDVGAAVYGVLGLFGKYEDVAGSSIVVGGGVSTPIAEIGWNNGSVLADPGGRPLGTVNGFSAGFGYLPAQLSVLSCETFVVDGNRGLKELELAQRAVTQTAKQQLAQPANVAALLGSYENRLYDSGGKNDWHYVSFSKIDDRRLKWTNRAGASWTLTLTDDKTKLAVGSDCPYYSDGHTTATVRWGADGAVKSITGPGDEPYDRVSQQAGSGLPSVAAGQATYLRVSDQALYAHARGGNEPGAVETLHPCTKSENYPNCQWIFEPSTTRSGTYYVRARDSALYMHARGGSKSGAPITLHPCPKDKDHPNCQWAVEPSQTRAGAIYLRSADENLYVHANGGSKSGNQLTLHACPKASNHPNCQWLRE